MEEWKIITDFNKYEASNLGNIRNKKSGKMLSTKLQNGYLCVSLSDSENKIKRRSIHRLVGITFINNDLNKPIINHKNSNKLDNIADNLEWVTQKENIKHALENGLTNFYKTPITQMDLNNNIIKTFNSIKEIENEYNYDRSHIIKVCKGRGKTAYGFKWRYSNIQETISEIDIIGKNYKEYTTYVVTKYGQIYSKKTKKYLKPIVNNNGHCYVTFSKDGEKKNFYIHVLVANLYIVNPHNYSTVIHKNGDKLNNKKENLEWVKYFNQKLESS
jgi:NUMOD4 motif